MKHLTSLLSPCSQKRPDAPSTTPDGIPTGAIYSFTYAPPPAPHGAAAEPEILVLVKLTDGPMLMGALVGVTGLEVRVGAPVRMIFPLDDQEENPANGRHLFEPLRRAGSRYRPKTQTRMLEATAA